MPNNEDSEFWNQVLQRFTASKLELSQVTTERTKLADELKQVKEERDKLRKELAQEKQEKAPAIINETRTTTPERQDRDISFQCEGIVDARKLYELERGISKTQESYRKMEQQLKDNELMIQDLLSNNQLLRSQRNLMELERTECKNGWTLAEANLQKALSESESLRERLRSWVREPVARTEANQPPTHSENALRLEIEQVYQPRIASLERQLEDLRNANRNLEASRTLFQEELEAARAKLSKLKLSKSSLHSQLKGLGELTRREALRSQSSSIRTAASQGAASPRSTISSLVVSSASKASNSLSKQLSVGTMDGRTFVDLSRIEDEIIAEDNAPTPRPPFAPMSIPPFRQQELTGFPVITPGIALGAENAFGRQFMTDTLGGCIQPLIVRVGKHKVLSKKNNMDSYLCPSLDHNPWCPSTPGQHGYIFVGLGREKDTFNKPEEHNVFVGLKKTGKDSLRRFTYLGKYRAVRVHSLTNSEWFSLPEHVKDRYVKTIQDKTKDTRSLEEIRKAYDAGELTVPCVQIQCIDFDRELYKTLVAANDKKKSKAKSSSSSSNKRALDYEADDDTARKRQTVKRVA